MKKKIKTIIAVAMAMCMCPAFTGCGDKSKSIDDITEKDLENAAEELDRSYTNSKDEVSEIETTSEIEELDPFEDPELLKKLTAINAYDAYSPFARLANFDVNTSNYYSSTSNVVIYTPDKYKDLKSGDIITVTAELQPKYEDKYVLTETEKDFVIEELPEYIQSVEEISQEVYDKMDSTLCDEYTAYLAKYHDSTINNMNLLGNYVLIAKNSDVTGYRNYVYFVYRITADFTKKDETVGIKEYYWCSCFPAVVKLADGTVSVDYSNFAKGKMDEFTVNAWYVDGCDDLDTLFNKNITAQINEYNYENTVTE